MAGLPSVEQAARECGLALLEASRVYDDLLLRRSKGLLRRRDPGYDCRTAVVGLVGRQRRLMSGAYVLADADHRLEAEILLRSMFEFLACQVWIALDPRRNIALWVKEDQRNRRAWIERLQRNAPALHDAARERLTPKQREAAEQLRRALPTIMEEIDAEVGDDTLPSIEERARLGGLEFYYDAVYRVASQQAHPHVYATDALWEAHRQGLHLRGAPVADHEPKSTYLKGAMLLRAALEHSGEHTPALRLPEVEELGRRLDELQQQRLNEFDPDWHTLLGVDVSE